jgi:hypothetical protein
MLRQWPEPPRWNWVLPNLGIQIARASRLTLLFESLLRSFALSPNTPPCSSTALPLYCADSPTRRSKPKACVKAARSSIEVKRSLVSSSSDQKGFCCPAVTVSGPVA